MKSTRRRTLVTTAVAAATLMATAAPAQAALLLYANPGYNGLIGSFSSRMSGIHNISWNNNDSLTSFKNQTSMYAAFWHDTNGGGRCFTAAPGDQNAELGWWDNDAISSFQLGRSC